MNNIPITITGNLTADAELRFTPSGKQVANFNVAYTPRISDGSGGWKDGDTSFYRCNIWGKDAENAVQTLAKGMRVIVTGHLTPRTWHDEKKDVDRISLEIRVDEVGPSLKFATAVVTKQGKGGPPATEDPWANTQPAQPQARQPQPAAAPAGPALGFDDEPPF